MSPLQKAFEDAVFRKLFTSGIHLNPAPNPRAMGVDRLIPDPDCPTQEEFCRKGVDGQYLEESLNPAWWAWQRAVEFCADFCETRQVMHGTHGHVNVVPWPKNELGRHEGMTYGRCLRLMNG